jgi:putative transposase
MANTYSNILAHIIFSTKHREPTIDAELKPRLHAYMGGVVRNTDGTLLAIGGVEDHVHLLVQYPPRMAASDLVRDVKANSSRWVREECERTFAWQTGSAIFSVSESVAPDVKAYIERQEEHHRSVSFKDELIAFLRKHNVEFKEEYLD